MCIDDGGSLTAMSFLETVSERLEMVIVVMVVIPLERERAVAAGVAWFPVP